MSLFLRQQRLDSVCPSAVNWEVVDIEVAGLAHSVVIGGKRHTVSRIAFNRNCSAVDNLKSWAESQPANGTDPVTPTRAGVVVAMTLQIAVFVDTNDVIHQRTHIMLEQ